MLLPVVKETETASWQSLHTLILAAVTKNSPEVHQHTSIISESGLTDQGKKNNCRVY